jgi:hypothetical protein
MTKTRILCIPLLSALAATSLAKSAHADEYVIILLDQTGSMCADKATCPKVIDGTDPNWTSLPPWINAVEDAKAWVNDDWANGGTTQRYYAIWTFKNTQDGTQTSAKLLWPTTAFSDTCTSITTINAESSFCKVAKTQAAYAKVQSVLETIKDKAGEVPQATWMTPLADSICRGLSEVWPSSSSQNRTIILESDGGENFSDKITTKCFGPAATNTNINAWSDLTSKKSTSDWGITPVGAWQANVLRRATRLGKVGQVDPPFDAAEAAAVAAGPLGGSDDMNPYLAMKVSVHYTVCKPTDSDPVCVLKSTATATSTATSTLTTNAMLMMKTGLQSDGQAGSPAVAHMALMASSASTASSVNTATQTTTSIDVAELGFFRALGGSTPRSKLREVVRDSSVVYGVPHKLAGDVDDSGCTDRADYNIITQGDVWMHRAVRPCEICQRADLNRDGWVNELDRSIVLANWGKGCINNPGPKPTP